MDHADEHVLDRAIGAVLGTAVGDVMGAPYEFGSAPFGPDGAQLIGGGLGNCEPGEWTDDTSMTWCVLDAAHRFGGLTADAALDRAQLAILQLANLIAVSGALWLVLRRRTRPGLRVAAMVALAGGRP